MTTGTTPKLSRHQQRVIAALAALADAHDWPWWDRDHIGSVVQAGGFHATIQARTMIGLKRLGLVQTEDSHWPDWVRELVRCGCACFYWGLTPEGRRVAASLKVYFSAETQNRIARAFAGYPPDERRDDGEERWREIDLDREE